VPLSVGIDRASETRLRNGFFVVREEEVEDGEEIPELVPGATLGPRGRVVAEQIQRSQIAPEPPLERSHLPRPETPPSAMMPLRPIPMSRYA
jgi:hypothetical protein